MREMSDSRKKGQRSGRDERDAGSEEKGVRRKGDGVGVGGWGGGLKWGVIKRSGWRNM